MATIRLDDAQPGMVLAEDARDRTGRLLLKSGHELTEKALKVFRMWGVSEVHVEGAEEEADSAPPAAHLPSLPPEVVEAASTRMTHVFRHADGRHPMVAELFRLATARLAARLAGTQHDGS